MPCGRARHPHHFLSVTKQGVAAIVATGGQPRLPPHPAWGQRRPELRRGGASPRRVQALSAAALPPRLMIDCSHANSGKDHQRQAGVAREVAAQVRDGMSGIVGVMMESFLVDGRQDHEGKASLTYGQSITDACMSWERTEPLLDELAEASRTRRRRLAATA